MVIHTRIPKHTNCVRFSGSNHSTAFGLASLFLKGKGRIANAIDVAKARVKYGFNHPIWQCYITTSSTEWLGLNKFDEPVIVVLHDKSPLLDAQWLKKHYTRNKNNHKFNVVSREMFHDVCEGKYGPVQIISLSEAVSQENENRHNYGYMNREQLEVNKLFWARVGNPIGVKEYLDIHEAGSFQEKIGHEESEEDCAFIECKPDEYFPSFVGLLKNPQAKVVDLTRSPIDLQKEVIAHFITFGCVMHTNGGLTTEISLSNTGCDCGFLAITDDKEEIRFAHKVHMYMSKSYQDFLPRLFVPADTQDVENFYQIGEQKGWYYTYQNREKIPIGKEQKEWFVTSDPTFSVEGQPKYLVKDLKPLGRRTIKILAKDGFYTYQMVKNLFKNSEANAFEIINGFKTEGKYYVAVIAYYKMDAYTDRIIPTESEILGDYKLLGRII